MYPCKPQFYYIKVGFKGVKIIEVCFRDDLANITGFSPTPASPMGKAWFICFFAV